MYIVNIMRVFIHSSVAHVPSATIAAGYINHILSIATCVRDCATTWMGENARNERMLGHTLLELRSQRIGGYNEEHVRDSAIREIITPEKFDKTSISHAIRSRKWREDEVTSH